MLRSDFGTHRVVVTPDGFDSWEEMNRRLEREWSAGREVECVSITEALHKAMSAPSAEPDVCPCCGREMCDE